MEAYTLAGLVTLFSSLTTFLLAFNVGQMRRKHKANVLEKTKAKEVIVANRAHMNMVEMSVVYLPILWVASVFGPTTIAGIVGAVWLGSRVWYSLAYLKDPSLRTVPFVLGVACTAVTVLLALYGIIV